MKRILIHRRYGDENDFTDTAYLDEENFCRLKNPTHFIEVWSNGISTNQEDGKDGMDWMEGIKDIEDLEFELDFTNKRMQTLYTIAIFKIRAK